MTGLRSQTQFTYLEGTPVHTFGWVLPYPVLRTTVVGVGVVLVSRQFGRGLRGGADVYGGTVLVTVQQQ